MARPVTQRRGGVPYGVPQRGATVNLEVNAPLLERTGPSSAEQLARVLGVAAEPVIDYAGQRLFEEGRKTATQGLADAASGKIRADKYREKGNRGGLMNFEKRTYSEAVDRYTAIREVNGAIDEVSEWINTEGALLPPGEFEVELDRRMKEILGEDFANDPVMAAEIAPRYANFIQKAVSAHRANAIEQQKQRSLETATSDVLSRLKDGVPVDLGFEINELARTQGDRAFAVKALVDTYREAAIAAAREGDPETAAERGNAILAMLEADLPDDNGGMKPGPGKSALHSARLQETRDQIAKIHEERNKAARAVQKFRIESGLQDIIDSGERIGLDVLIPLGLEGWLSDEEMLSWYRAGGERHAKTSMRRERIAYLLETQNRSWADLVDDFAPDGSKYKQEDFEDALTEIIGSYPPEQRFVLAMEWTAKTGLVYQPLKNRLANVSDTADPQDLSALHDEYTQLKLRGLAHEYVTDETAMKYERLSDLLALGLDHKTMVAELRRDKDEADTYVSQFKPHLDKKMADTEVFGQMPGDDSLVNSPYVARQMNTLALLGLRQGLSPERAVEAAKQRFEESHMAIETPDDRTIILPKVAGVSQEAMEYAYQELIPEIAERNDLDPAQLRFIPIGEAGEMILADQNGLRVTPDVYSTSMLSQWYEQRKRASAIEQFKDKAEMERLKRTDPEGFKRLQKQAAIERQRKVENDLMLYARERAKSVVGGAANLPLSMFDFDVNASKGGRTRGRRRAAALAASDESVEGNLHEDIPSNLLELQPVKLVEHTLAVAQQEGVPADLVRGVVMMESSGGRMLRNRHSSARGPMQILKGTFDEMNRKHFGDSLDWNDVRDQTKASIRYLKDQLERFRNQDVATLAYFLGEGRVQKLLDRHDGDVDAFLDMRIANNVTPRTYLATVRQYAHP